MAVKQALRHPRQVYDPRKIYDEIAACINTNGYAPSVRELMAATGIASPATAHDWLHRLRDEYKVITFRDGMPRTLRIIADWPEG